MDFLNQTITYLGYVFILALVLLIGSSIFYTKYKKVFYISLIFIASYLYAWLTINLVASHYGPGPFVGPTHRVTVPFAPLLEAVRATFFTITVYSFVGIAISLIRRIMKRPAKKILLLSTFTAIIGLTGLLVFYLLPCNLSPDGCKIEPLSLPVLDR